MHTHLNSTFQSWLNLQFPERNFSVDPLTGDAGFRRYYRLKFSDRSIIAVDAPPDKSNNVAFVAIAQALSAKSVKVPEVLRQNIQQGFFCLSDFGCTLLSDKLTADNMKVHYKNAIDQLLLLMPLTSGDISNYQLPVYNADFVALELAIFPQWLLSEHLHINLTDAEKSQLSACFDVLIANVLAQPSCFMHRDYHSRNLMLLADDSIGVIDFQDAVQGPLTYDIVSLLRDCYVCWPEQDVAELFQYFKQQASSLKLFSANELAVDNDQWQRWFDLMGIQRHIKASGIFARLHHRDGKNGYLADIPLTLSYLVDVTEKYPELKFLRDLVINTVLPALENKIAQQGCQQ